MKIDIVYTWVDGSDSNWNRKRKEKAKIEKHLLSEANSDARFMDNNELKFSLRSIYKYAPWINNIFIVTDNQVPKWLNVLHPKIKIIDHSEIFIDKSVLPTFSARGIESQLHHIKDLAEHFIYFNDDMFLGNHCTPEHFYINDNIARVFVSEIISSRSKKAFDINKRPKHKRNDHQYAIVNSRNLVKERFNKSIYFNIRHGAKPLLKSKLYEIEEVFGDKLKTTARNSFRTNEDVLMLHLFEYYAIIKKFGKTKYLKTVSKKSNILDLFSFFISNYTFGYINLHDKNISANLDYIKGNKPFMICLNQTPETPIENLERIKQFLESYYNEKSPFEI